MKLGPREAWRLLRSTLQNWNEDKAPQLGAALAFYTALSIAPLVVITLGVVAFFFGQDAGQGELVGQLRTLVGDDGGKAIEDMIASANKPTEGFVATGLSIATLLFGASGVFGQHRPAYSSRSHAASPSSDKSSNESQPRFRR
jgi:membrane protein